MNTMLDFVKEQLPGGAVLEKVKELSDKYRFHLCYGGFSVQGEIPKAVAPGYENRVARRTVATCMSQVNMKAGDFERAYHWLEIASAGEPGTDTAGE